jgi:hypothetical protein
MLRIDKFKDADGVRLAYSFRDFFDASFGRIFDAVNFYR